MGLAVLLPLDQCDSNGCLQAWMMDVPMSMPMAKLLRPQKETVWDGGINHNHNDAITRRDWMDAIEGTKKNIMEDTDKGITEDANEGSQKTLKRYHKRH